MLGTPTIACNIDSIVYKCMYLFRTFNTYCGSGTFGGDFSGLEDLAPTAKLKSPLILLFYLKS